jgi:osmotically inducible lipoprotein OsmB
MKKLLILAVAAMSLSACNSPGERAVGGALIGGGTGALIGGLAGGGRGALIGGGIGAAGGAIIGASTAQPQPAPCPYGTYRDAYGNIYCR